MAEYHYLQRIVSLQYAYAAKIKTPVGFQDTSIGRTSNNIQHILELCPFRGALHRTISYRRTEEQVFPENGQSLYVKNI